MIHYLHFLYRKYDLPIKGNLRIAMFVALHSIGSNEAYTQGCLAISPLPCDSIQVNLPFQLFFDNPVAGSIPDKNGKGTGFKMVQDYSGTRLAQDGIPSDNHVKGYLPSNLLLSGGRLQIVSNKGLSFLKNNNQINTLGVKIKSNDKIQVTVDIINPHNGQQDQQAGIWLGLHDKTFLKLSVSENKVELRRELNDVSSTVKGQENPDQRITSVVSNLHLQTLRLKLIIDPAADTASGFYSTDNGKTFQNVGSSYAASSISVTGMALTNSTAYTGIFASYRNGSSPVTYHFDDFSISKPQHIQLPDYEFMVTDAWLPGALVGKLTAVCVDNSTVKYSILSGNTNSTFILDANHGNLTLGRRVNHHAQSTFTLNVVAIAGQQPDTARVTIQVHKDVASEPIQAIDWSAAASQPYKVSEAQGEVVNGKLYSFGGFDSQKIGFTPTKRAYVYDPVTNKWSPIADLPHTPNGSGFGGVTHAGLANNGTNIYLAGGYTSNAAGTGQTFGTQQVWRYNVASNTYTKLPDLPVKIAAGQLEYLQGKLHHIAGTNAARTQDLGDHYVLDLDNLADGWKALAPLPNPRQHAGAAAFEEKIYYIGGQHGHDQELVTQKDVHVYDCRTDSWTRLADLPAPGNDGLGHISSSVVIVGDQIIVMGGEAVHQTNVSALVSAYFPAGNTWTSLTPLPAPRFSGVAAVLNGNLYYTGGSKTNITYKGTPTTNNAAKIGTSQDIGEKRSGAAISKMTISPNPAYDGHFNIQLENFGTNQQVTVFVTNSSGRVVYTNEIKTNENGNACLEFPGMNILQNSKYTIKAQSFTSDAAGSVLIP